MKKVIKQIKNTLAFAIVFAAVAKMNEWHWLLDVFEFFTWFLVIQYQMFVRVASKPKPRTFTPADDAVHRLVTKLKKSYCDGHHFARWLDNFVYLCLALFLVAMGHWVLAILWVLIGAGDLTIRHIALEEQKESSNASKN